MRGDQGPAVAVILRSVEPRLLRFRLHQRPDATRAGGRYRNAELAKGSRRQPRIARDLGPGFAAVGGAEEATPRPPARDVPEVPARLPEGSKKDAGVVRIHAQIGGTCIRVAIQHLAPGLAAVARAEDPAFLVRAKGIAECRDVDEIGVPGMDLDAADEPGLTEPQMTPGAAGIRRFVDTVAIGYIEPDLGLPAAGIEHVGVRAGDGERTDGGGSEIAVADTAPIDPVVDRLPHTAGAGAEIEYSPFFRIARDRYDPATAGRPNAAPFEGVKFRCRAGKPCHGKCLVAGPAPLYQRLLHLPLCVLARIV
jgi:hypothetical protein